MIHTDVPSALLTYDICWHTNKRMKYKFVLLLYAQTVVGSRLPVISAFFSAFHFMSFSLVIRYVLSRSVIIYIVIHVYKFQMLQDTFNFKDTLQDTYIRIVSHIQSFMCCCPVDKIPVFSDDHIGPILNFQLCSSMLFCNFPSKLLVKTFFKVKFQSNLNHL